MSDDNGLEFDDDDDDDDDDDADVDIESNNLYSAVELLAASTAHRIESQLINGTLLFTG